MSLELYYTDNEGAFVLASNRVRIGALELSMQAAECAVGESTLVIDDPDGTFYTPGHKPLYVIETEAVDDEWMGIMGVFWTWDRTIRRGPYRTGGAREVVITLKDVNTLLSLRIQKGTDAQRDQESDETRVDWLINTAEVIGGFGDEGFTIEETEFFFTGDPVTMSETDYTGNDSAGVLNDAMQDSAKNAYLYNRAAPGEPIRIGIWYGATQRTDFTSLHSISDYLSDITPETLDYFVDSPPDHETGYTFGPSVDAELNRDPSRQITGGLLQWDGGNTYGSLPVITPSMTRRDMVFSGELVKNATQATQRINSYLNRLDTEDDAITCAVLVPAKLVNGFHQGHRVPVRFEYMALEGYADEPVNMRIAKRSVRYVDAGLYEIGLDLRAESPPGPPAPEPPGPFVCEGGAYDATPSGEYPRLGSVTSNAAMVNYYWRPGHAEPHVPTFPYTGSWHFPVFDGTADFNVSNLNVWRIIVVGPGTLTIHTVAQHRGGGGTTATEFAAVVKHREGPVDVDDVTHDGVPGVDLTFEIEENPDAEDCVSYVDVSCPDFSGNGGMGANGCTWVLADA